MIDDVTPLGGMYVGWPDDAYYRMAALLVPTVANMDTELTGFPRGVIGPYAAGDANTEEVQVRCFMWCPPRYALLINPGTDVQMAWRIFAPALIAEGKEAECAPLLAALRAALTLNATNTVAVARARPTPIIPDLILARTLEAHLLQDLPGRDITRVTAEMQSVLLAQQLHAFDQRTQAMANNTTKAIANTRAPKTPEWAYGAAVVAAYKRNAGDDDQCLSPVYYAVAAAPKGGTRGILQGQLDVQCQDTGSVAVRSYFVSLALDQKFQGMKRHGHDKRALDLGINLLDFPFLGKGQHLDQEKSGAMMDLMEGETTSLDAAALKNCNDVCKGVLPSDPISFMCALKGHSTYINIDQGDSGPRELQNLC